MAGDFTVRRRDVALEASNACGKFVDALNALIELKDVRLQIGDFVDADFTDQPDIQHISPGVIGTLFDFVVGDLQTAYIDAGNGNRARNILLQMRQGGAG